jgi:hypothetical protein
LAAQRIRSDTRTPGLIAAVQNILFLMLQNILDGSKSPRQIRDRVAARSLWRSPDRRQAGSERLTGALLDRLTHHVHILEMNGESYRLKGSKQRRSPKPRS